jgi:hypothetical protein
MNRTAIVSEGPVAARRNRIGFPSDPQRDGNVLRLAFQALSRSVLCRSTLSVSLTPRPVIWAVCAANQTGAAHPATNTKGSEHNFIIMEGIGLTGRLVERTRPLRNAAQIRLAPPRAAVFSPDANEIEKENRREKKGIDSDTVPVRWSDVG